MPAATVEQRTRFPGLNPASFEHPLDRAALETLRKTPGLDMLLKKISAVYLERIVRLTYTANSLRLSPKQCPRIYSSLQEAASILDMKVPELYLNQDPFPNVLATGMQKHTIVVTSGLVDLLTEEELRGQLGNALGHIKSGHMLYRSMAVFLMVIGAVAIRNMPFLSLVTEALKYALYDWYRKSELSADRAGLLVTQDPAVSASILLKLAAGSTGGKHDLNLEEFLKQADDYEDMGTNILDAFYTFEMTRFEKQPFPALRAREIDRWGKSQEYRSILRGDYARAEPEAEMRRCPKCATPVYNPVFRFCPECGEELKG
jgi:Zn-dependent protease with chaperone function